MIITSPKHLSILAASQRQSLGLSQTDVAKQVGLTQKTISKFESHPESVMLSTAFLILSALQLDVKITPKEAHQQSGQWTEEW